MQATGRAAVFIHVQLQVLQPAFGSCSGLSLQVCWHILTVGFTTTPGAVFVQKVCSFELRTLLQTASPHTPPHVIPVSLKPILCVPRSKSGHVGWGCILT
jgi:hypothetical protein